MVSEMTHGEVTNISDARIDDEKIMKALIKLRCPKCGGHEWVLFRQTYGPERIGVFDAKMGEFFQDGDEMADLFIVCRNCENRWGIDDYPKFGNSADSS
jgi:DNA-directed RNA polymerase subunit M/transcription elongation factor TFIIS